ncbi:MAG TPA: triple tyrosine motif-containing protein, partial [Flavobacteriaceae bacterium]|nr:triple tyrosine motif-containing protein [Flavobacteriaceae bacterium]
FESIKHLDEEEYIIGNLNGYTFLNLSKVQPKQYKVQINAIYKQIINNPKKKLELNELASLKSNEKNLYFEFSVPEYKKTVEVDYQYRLLGLYDEWSNWSSTSSASFENLPYGEYTFQVKARIGNEITENTANYTFEIDKPWFLSTVALITYLLITLIIFLLIHNFYKRYYQKQEQKLIDKKQRELAVSKLESEKLIMKLRNDKLRNEIDSKTRELATSTLSIVKKNEILNTIKKELLSIDKKSDVNTVIKIIDNNLSTEGDWAKFKEAFNNADTDFLKKVKEIHPNLTPNDLRLCAYLRLNLSSKEIAPLLNISPRSVEIKRYRLRKKMELPHKQSLVEYILNI